MELTNNDGREMNNSVDQRRVTETMSGLFKSAVGYGVSAMRKYRPMDSASGNAGNNIGI